jgi:hypothetical protein
VEDLELRRTRALAQLRMYAGLLTQLEAQAEYCRLLRTAAGIDSMQWEKLDHPGREYALAKGRMALLRAAKVSRRAWNAMPAYSDQRSAVMLKGAEALGIDTRWAGWAGPEASP